MCYYNLVAMLQQQASVIDANRIDELRDRLTAYCKEHVTAEEYIPVVAIDAELPVDDIDVDIIDRVSALDLMGWLIAHRFLL